MWYGTGVVISIVVAWALFVIYYEDFESWDSLRHMNIILAVEEKFNFEFTEEQIDKLVNVRSFIEFI